MKRNLNSLIGYGIVGNDGVIGEVEEFYFDDNTWTIRYLIVKTEELMLRREILLPVSSLTKTSWKIGWFPAEITTDQVINSPLININKPISRLSETELFEYYKLVKYWGSGFYGNTNKNKLNVSPLIPIEGNENKDHDPHIRSTKRITGYLIHASDGEIGHVADFIMDDQNWQIINIVVNTHHWIGGTKVLIPVKNVSRVEWFKEALYLNMTIEKVKKSELYKEAEIANSQ